jgi:hypothetical protein
LTVLSSPRLPERVARCGVRAPRPRTIASRLLFSAFGLALVGCAAIPAPHILTEIDDVAKAPSAVEAKTYAPSAFAAAEKLRTEAHDALQHDRQAHAQFLAEQALAAYAEASALARVARAERRFEEADLKRQASDKELAGLKAEVDRAQADVEGVETQLKVVRDAVPITPSGPASPEREAARKDAARALLMQGKLLCTAAHIFADAQSGSPPKLPSAPPQAKDSPDAVPDDIRKDLAAAEGDLSQLETTLAGTGTTPIDLATRTRAACLSLLGRSRRAAARPSNDATKQATDGSDSDKLLGELSAFASKTGGSLDPERDERGIVVTVRPVFEGENVTAGAKARLEDLDRVAAAHPTFGVALVLHADGPTKRGDDDKVAARVATVARLFQSVPKDRLVTLSAGNFLPVVDPHGQDRAKNARLEVIFIPPAP